MKRKQLRRTYLQFVIDCLLKRKDNNNLTDQEFNYICMMIEEHRDELKTIKP